MKRLGTTHARTWHNTGIFRAKVSYIECVIEGVKSFYEVRLQQKYNFEFHSKLSNHICFTDPPSMLKHTILSFTEFSTSNIGSETSRCFTNM